MDNTKITIFTPTYNRAYRLHNLYASLLTQHYKNFEWLIIDDGSTDDTKFIINSFKVENKIDITYVKQTNQGKHVAINNGVKLAKGELFFIVDSDDELTDDSLQIVNGKYQSIKTDPKIAGIVGVMAIKNGDKLLENNFAFTDLICSSIDFRYKYNFSGDMAEVFRTEIIRQYPFPVYSGEIFSTESIVWNRIAQKYNLLYFNTIVYISEYLEDGLTAKYWNLLMQNPQGSMLYYSELSKAQIPLKHKLKMLNLYWKIALNNKSISFYEKFKKTPSFKSIYILIVLSMKHLKKRVYNN